VRRRIEAICALCLLSLAAGLGVWGQGLIAGFGLLAALLIGGALALPPMIDLATKIGQKSAGSALSEWFWADTRQQLPSLSLALMALLLAMAANVGVSTMVSSFRLTFQGFLDQRLAAEGYVYADTEEQAKALQPWLASRTDAVLPIQKVDIAVRGLPTEVYGPIDHETYRSNWTFLTATPTVWDDLHGGGGVVINEQLSRRSGLALGDVVPVGGRDFVVVGIYGDYGNPIGQAMIDAGDFVMLFPDAVPLRFGIRVADSALPDIFADLQSEFGLPVANMVNQAGIKSFSMGVFDRTFVVTAALNILTLAVAGFAILMSLLTLAGLRVPQLAPVWALGMTRRTLGGLELGRAVLLAVLTALCAVPLGLALAWALLSVVNVEAFGWKLPMFLFPQDYLRLIGQAVIAAMIAAAWPAWKLQRTAPADLLKVFANER
jgi:putative ABC transport system permease protein